MGRRAQLGQGRCRAFEKGVGGRGRARERAAHDRRGLLHLPGVRPEERGRHLRLYQGPGAPGTSPNQTCTGWSSQACRSVTSCTLLCTHSARGAGRTWIQAKLRSVNGKDREGSSYCSAIRGLPRAGHAPHAGRLLGTRGPQRERAAFPSVARLSRPPRAVACVW